MEAYSVTDINTYIKNKLTTDNFLQKIMVRGEISNFKRHSSGHCYLTLKDEDTTLKAVIFRSAMYHIHLDLQNGQKIIATGSVNVYPKGGTYQLYITQAIPDGQGALSLYYEKLKKSFTEEGLFDARYKKALPLYPRRIGIITSRTGAVLHDIFHVSSLRNPHVQLLLYPVDVQGSNSAPQIVQALQYFNENPKLCEVIILGRGGGSLEDLWSFNDERVVRAVFASKIPVVSAVGHETDYTLTDYVSDRRAATPSQAAELCVPSRQELLQQVAAKKQLLRLSIKQQLRQRQIKLQNCKEKLTASNIQKQILEKRVNLQEKWRCIDKAVRDKINLLRHRQVTLAAKLTLLNPEQVLKRGYGLILTGPEQRAVNTISAVRVGDDIQICLRDGFLQATVNRVEKGNWHGKKNI